MCEGIIDQIRCFQAFLVFVERQSFLDAASFQSFANLFRVPFFVFQVKDSHAVAFGSKTDKFGDSRFSLQLVFEEKKVIGSAVVVQRVVFVVFRKIEHVSKGSQIIDEIIAFDFEQKRVRVGEAKRQIFRSKVTFKFIVRSVHEQFAQFQDGEPDRQRFFHFDDVRLFHKGYQIRVDNFEIGHVLTQTSFS